MFRSLFAKYFSAVSIVILISFILTGALQVIVFRQYWVTEKKNLLEETAERLAKRTVSKVVEDPLNENKYLVEPEIREIIDMVSGTIDGNVYVVQNNGGLFIYTSSSEEGLFSENQSEDSLNELTAKMAEGSIIYDEKDLDGYLSSHHFTVGFPIDLGNDKQLGYVFASISSDGLNEQTLTNMRVIFLSMIGILMVTFVTVYIITFRLVRPLRDMASATRLFGMGDFSYRIPVIGRDEIAELAVALNKMADSLSSVEDVRRSFIANVSHELKTPMTTISGFIDGILDGTIPEERHDHYLNLVSDETKRLSRLVSSMLELSRLDSQEFETNFIPFDLREMVCHTILTFEQRIEERQVNVEGLDVSPNLRVYSDKDLIGQVIYNLIENAVKFVDEGGTITIRLYRNSGRVYCSIRNTGTGIPADEMPHIFEKFYKSDSSRSLDKQGLGLGLYIVKTIINLCNGEIYVRSVEGDFGEFEFWLPEAHE